MVPLRMLIIGVLLMTGVSCDSRSNTTPSAAQTMTRPAYPPTSRPVIVADDAAVAKIVAELLGLKETEVRPTSTLASLKMDDLDLVEVVMELEDQYQISIPDERIDAFGSKSEEIMRKMTVHDLGNIVRECQNSPTTRLKSSKP